MQDVSSYPDGGEIVTTVDAPPPPPPDDSSFADEKIKAPEVEPPVNGHAEEVEDEDEDDQEGDLGEDLFGDGEDDQDDSVDHDAVVAAAASPGPGEEPVADEEDDKPRRPLDEYGNEISEEELRKRRELEYEEREDDGQGYVEHEHIVAEAKLANLPNPFASDGKVWDLRLPNFIALESSAYTDAAILEPDPETEAEGPKSHLPDENIIRWQWVSGDDGTLHRQSNARVVRWSDGSESLQIGSELFDMINQVDHAAVRSAPPAGPNSPVKPESIVANGVPSQHAASLASAPHPSFGKASHPLTYLFAQHDYARLLEAQTAIHGTITLRPTGTTSAAHRALVNRATSRPGSGPSTPGTGQYRVRKTNVISIMVDPEREKAEIEAQQVKKAKEAKKLAAAERRKSAGGRAKGRNIRRAKFHARLFSDEEEMGGAEGEEDEDEDDEEGGTRTSRATGERRQPKRGTGGVYAGGDDEDDEGFVVPDEDEDASTSDDEDAEGSAVEGEEGEKKKRKKEKSSSVRREADDAPLEDLEVAEKEIEQQEREAKRRRKEGPSQEAPAVTGDDDAMDLDSGEEAGNAAPIEEAPAQQGRRRLVIESDEED